MVNPLIFHRNKTPRGEPIAAWGDATILSSSIGLGWQGIQIEVGRGCGYHVEDYTYNGHCIALNLADEPLRQKYRDGSVWKSSRMPPLTFWINPEGRPVSYQHSNNIYCALCLVDGKFLDSVMGRHYELREGIGVADELLTHLLQALIAIIQDKKRRYTNEFANELIHAFVYALAAAHGNPASELSAKRGLTPSKIEILHSWLEKRVGDPMTIDLMASQVGLSTAHFAREFKRATGQTPWDYFIHLRLECARKLLVRGETGKNIAVLTGFSDQPHLSRLFRRRFGVSPSDFVKISKMN